MKLDKMTEGTLKQVIGPTIDVEFPPKQLPNILNAIKIIDKERNIDLTAEVAMQLGENMVRCIALSSTDGLIRGMKAIDTGAPISVPVGSPTLGRLFNLLGDPIDQLEAIPNRRCAPLFIKIHLHSKNKRQKHRF